MEKTLLTINSVDYSAYLSKYTLEFNVLIKDEGTNARGTKVLSVLNRKAVLNIVFRMTDETEMAAILTALQPYVLTIGYWDPETQTQKSGTFYKTNSIADFFHNISNDARFNELPVQFKEL